MFFKQSILKRILKTAYKSGGITVGCTGSGKYHITSGWWRMWFEADSMPKEAKGAVIELCGDLPKERECFLAMEKFGNQYEINLTEYEPFKAKEKYTVTKYGNAWNGHRYLQGASSGEIKAIDEIIIALIDQKAINEEDGETCAVGPILDRRGMMTWWNDRCRLEVCMIESEEEKDLLDLMGTIKLK